MQVLGGLAVAVEADVVGAGVVGAVVAGAGVVGAVVAGAGVVGAVVAGAGVVGAVVAGAVVGDAVVGAGAGDAVVGAVVGDTGLGWVAVFAPVVDLEVPPPGGCRAIRPRQDDPDAVGSTASFAVSYGRAVPSVLVPARSNGAFLSVRTGGLSVHRGLSM